MAVLEELGRYILEVSVKDFICNYLPLVDVDIDEIIKKLHENEHISQEGMWSSFPIDPAESKEIKTDVFMPFKGILDIIAEYIRGFGSLCDLGHYTQAVCIYSMPAKGQGPC